MCVLFHLIDAQSKDHEDFCGRFNGDCDDCLSASNVNDFNVLHVYVCMYVILFLGHIGSRWKLLLL